ncbi:hypothetical protein QAD02_005982 [Eretmocerus hayati]|uniref:Uncharacterized protein n=1 Tax=Eretmocerus hayati TaxID=131215 RepID=A0ACC2N3R6_9HYME|nr:hypothetical protein QAD02_005982 [Eretmocerus hayati]
MNEEYKKGGCCYGSSSHEVQFNTLEAVRKYKLLESAVSQGQRDLVESLLESGAAVNGHPVCNQLRTPLHSSIRLGDVKIVEKLLSAGASVNVEYFGDTPLTLAAKLGKLELVDLLLLAAGLENSTSHEKITHFHIACMRNRIDVVQRLLQFQQDVNAVVDSNSCYWPGFTPLHFAVQSQCSEIVEFLLNIGANII